MCAFCPLSAYCAFCNQLKPGGPISEKGKKITILVRNVKDLSRDVIKVCPYFPRSIRLLEDGIFSDIYNFNEVVRNMLVRIATSC